MTKTKPKKKKTTEKNNPIALTQYTVDAAGVYPFLDTELPDVLQHALRIERRDPSVSRTCRLEER